MKQKDQIDIAKELMEQGIPFMTALVMAGDIQSQYLADELVAQGRDPKDVMWMIGSYARFGWACKNLEKKDLLEMLPDLWVLSDPDDSKSSYLKLWREAAKDGKVYKRRDRVLSL